MKRSVSAIDWASAACSPRPVMAAANGSWDSSLLHTKSDQKEGGREGADTQSLCHTQSVIMSILSSKHMADILTGDRIV